VKALSLWQPWASLICIGVKRIETRHWPTSYRGTLAIHAAMKWDHETAAALDDANLVLRAADLPVLNRPLPGGAIVAVCRLVGCEQSRGPDRWPTLERAFGDLSEGRWAWRLADVRALDPPVPCRGMQGLWTVPDGLLTPIVDGEDFPRRPSLFADEP
jgi:activating signal cointegrator 1